MGEQELAAQLREADEQIAALLEALAKVAAVPKQRNTTGHLYDCAWCNGSADIARKIFAAIKGKPSECPTCGSPDPKLFPVHPIWQDAELPMLCKNEFHGEFRERGTG